MKNNNVDAVDHDGVIEKMTAGLTSGNATSKKNKNDTILLDEEAEEKKGLDDENVDGKQKSGKQNNAKSQNKMDAIKQRFKNNFGLKLNLDIKTGGTRIETDNIINMKQNCDGNKNVFSFDQRDINENTVAELTTGLFSFKMNDDIKKNNTSSKIINTLSKSDVVDIFQDKNEDKTQTGLSGKKRRRDDENEAYDKELKDSANNDETQNKIKPSEKEQKGV